MAASWNHLKETAVRPRPTRRRWVFTALSMLALSSPVEVQAQSSSICAPSGYYLAFFNGVFNTLGEASEGYERLHLLVGDSLRGEPISGSVLYNSSGKVRPGVTRLEDLAEVFIQRSAELDGVLSNR